MNHPTHPIAQPAVPVTDAEVEAAVVRFYGQGPVPICHGNMRAALNAFLASRGLVFTDKQSTHDWWCGQNYTMREVFYAAPRAPIAQPLSDIQVADLLQEKHFGKGYVLKHSDRTCLAWYRLGLRDGEDAHGIKGEVAA